MRKSRFTEEQIIGILKESEAGAATKDLLRRHGISHDTFYRWKRKYGGMEVSDARRPKQLQIRPHSSLGGRTPEEFASDTLGSGERIAPVLNNGVRE